MKLMGEIVNQLRTANGWTLQELAAHVRRHGAKNVQHQHLQQLESKPHTRPRYIIELAAAFGKSVEEMREWQPGMPAFGHHNVTTWGVHDSHVAPYNPLDGLLEDEKSLLLNYRSCNTEMQLAIQAILRAGRKVKHVKAVGDMADTQLFPLGK